jgi:CDP-glucose 4,6-dehydratase
LGGWLVKALLEQGAVPVVLVRDHAPQSMFFREDLARRCAIVRGSLQDFPLLRRTLSEYSVATAFHLAAQAIVSTAKVDPLGTLETNVQGTWNLLEACRQTKVSQILIASSDKAYGAHESLPYVESQALQGKFPYEVSKSCADLIAGMYATTYRLPVAVVRCANLFGGGDLNFSRLIPDLIRQTFEGRRFVIRSDGKFVRDFLYVEDAASAYLCLAEHLADHPELVGEAFNFSMEVRLTVLDLVQKILHTMGRADLEPIVQNSATNEIREQYLSVEKAHRLLGWSPQFSLEEGIRRTIAWYAEFFGTSAGADARLAKAAVDAGD